MPGEASATLILAQTAAGLKMSLFSNNAILNAHLYGTRLSLRARSNVSHMKHNLTVSI